MKLEQIITRAQVDRNLILACQAVLQSVNGSNPAATKAAHDTALTQLAETLGEFMKERGLL